GFVGEFLILVGAFQYNKIYAAIAVLGIILGAAYMLWLYQRMMFGTLDNPENKNLPDMNRREIAYMIPLIIFMFWIGIYPKPFIKIMEPAIINIVLKVNPGWDQRKKTMTIEEAEIRKGDPLPLVPAGSSAEHQKPISHGGE
ncbi:MAG TPA: Fe-S-binding domain-containing protein, partial [Nitrospiria bacterium]|nr:Fe-S-binding domain-containing protein [Nitrospiria bacterium]